MIQIPQILLIAGAILLASAVGNKLSERLGVPTLLVFLLVGILAGSEGPGGIYFDNPEIAAFVGSIALVFILFDGGLSSDWRRIRPVLGRGIMLSTVGVAVTALVMAVFAWAILGLPMVDSLLLSAIISSTDAPAVFAVLRSRRVRLQGQLGPLLEFESSSNDPMAVFLTIGLLQYITLPEHSWLQMLLSFSLSMPMGILAGVGMGKLASLLLRRIRLDHEGLYPVLSVALVLLTYGASECVHGNGYLAVYVCGIVLAGSDLPFKRSLVRFHDGIGWLMQIAMFVVLGLLVFPSHLLPVAGAGLLMALALMFVARPAAVLPLMLGSAFSWPQRMLVAWVGLRGAVPIVLATFPYTAGYPHSDLIFNVIFFIVLASSLMQGSTIMLAARRLHVDETLVTHPRYPLEFDKSEGSQSETREFEIRPDSVVVGKQIAELKLPQDALILLVRRGGRFVVPKGSTILDPLDNLLVIAESASFRAIEAILGETRA